MIMIACTCYRAENSCQIGIALSNAIFSSEHQGLMDAGEILNVTGGHARPHSHSY